MFHLSPKTTAYRFCCERLATFSLSPLSPRGTSLSQAQDVACKIPLEPFPAPHKRTGKSSGFSPSLRSGSEPPLITRVFSHPPFSFFKGFHFLLFKPLPQHFFFSPLLLNSFLFEKTRLKFYNLIEMKIMFICIMFLLFVSTCNKKDKIKQFSEILTF